MEAPSFLHITLTTPYRSTIAITSLASFVAKCDGLDFPERDFGSDVEGTKPSAFIVGKDERRMEVALVHCRKHLGDNATIVYSGLPDSIEKMVKEQGKEAGGAWDCYCTRDFYGWEAERVVAVTDGDEILELITRAKCQLFVILVGEDLDDNYVKQKKFLLEAADLGLVDIVQLGAVEINQAEVDIGDEVVDETSDVVMEA